MRPHSRALVGIPVAALLIFAPAASAAPVIATLNNISPGLSVRIWSPTGNIDTTAGVFNWTQQGGGGFQAFCIEIPERIGYGQTVTYNSTSLALAPSNLSGIPSWSNPGMGVAVADKISELWGRYYNTIGNDSLKGAAFQVSVWNLLYGRDVLVSGPAGLSSLVSTWTSSLNGTGPRASLEALTAAGTQDMVRSIPEPGTLVLWGLGASFFFLFSRRRLLRLTRRQSAA